MLDMTQVGSLMAAVMFLCAIFQQVFQRELCGLVQKYIHRMKNYCSPYFHIVFHEYQGQEFVQSTAYKAIEVYLATIPTNRAKHLKANVTNNLKNVFLSMDDYEEVLDEFKGIKIWWSSRKTVPEQTTLILDPRDKNVKWYYQLTCHKKHQDFIHKVYLNHVFEEGRSISQKKRERKLYTNSPRENSYYGSRQTTWSHILFEHPSTFDTLALDPKKKKDIINDIERFSRSKDYYNKIGKAWKRGYLLYGPPGTGKSSMIAAMANFLDYDIYYIELTSVKSNVKLRELLIDTSSKAIIVIEDIDCSLDLTGKRKENQAKETNHENKDTIFEMVNNNKKNESEMTLSGLLNSVDGLWSACINEKIIVFTTNHVDKLDPALIRSGRMDMHIELSYCCFEAFKVLAKNYLDVESHELFATICQLLEETNMTPADVAENLMPKSDEDNADTCLNKLTKCLKKAKEEKSKKSYGEKVQDEESTKIRINQAIQTVKA